MRRDVDSLWPVVCRGRVADFFLRDLQKSYLWALLASSSQFSVEHGNESALKEYSFGKEKYAHKVRVSGLARDSLVVADNRTSSVPHAEPPC